MEFEIFLNSNDLYRKCLLRISAKTLLHMPYDKKYKVLWAAGVHTILAVQIRIVTEWISLHNSTKSATPKHFGKFHIRARNDSFSSISKQI